MLLRSNDLASSKRFSCLSVDAKLLASLSDATRQAPRAGAGGRAAQTIQANDAGAASRRRAGRRSCRRSGRRARGPVRRRVDRRAPRSRVEPRGERPARRYRADASGRLRSRPDQRQPRRSRARGETRERACSTWRRRGRAVDRSYGLVNSWVFVYSPLRGIGRTSRVASIHGDWSYESCGSIVLRPALASSETLALDQSRGATAWARRYANATLEPCAAII